MSIAMLWGMVALEWAKEKRQLLFYQQLALFLLGGRWDSNPRHSEPQSERICVLNRLLLMYYASCRLRIVKQ